MLMFFVLKAPMKLMSEYINQVGYALSTILYPLVCVSCKQLLSRTESVCCKLCMQLLPWVENNDGQQNEVAEKLQGRIPSSYHFSLVHFHKNHFVQDIMHHIKYKNGKIIATELGQILGDKIHSINHNIDAIIALPLHPKKLQERGYNQALIIAEGISHQTGIPIINNFLIRTKHTESQTKKTRLERISNVSDAFEVNTTTQHKYTHYLIVDDVLTTGATIEAAAQTILAHFPHANISIATLGLATDH